jgi:hypothetical protein
MTLRELLFIFVGLIFSCGAALVPVGGACTGSSTCESGSMCLGSEPSRRDGVCTGVTVCTWSESSGDVCPDGGACVAADVVRTPCTFSPFTPSCPAVPITWICR